MNRENVETLYRLSPVQQGMLFHTLYAPQEGVYFEQFNLQFGGDFDPAIFERVWQELVDRNTILRTSFAWEGLEEPVQIVHKRVELPFEVLDWRDLPEEERKTKLEERIAWERRRGFDLSQPPLLRLSVIRLRDDCYHVIWNYHHLLLDGWSVGLLLQEVNSLYKTAAAGQPIHPQRRRPFRDYIAWLRQQDLSQAEVYWRRVLAGFTTPTPLGVDRPAGRSRPEELGRAMKVALIPEAETEILKEWARKNRLTLSTIVQGAWALVLSRYSGEDDLVYGLTVSGRPPSIPGVEAMLGCFINTLPVRVRMPAAEPVVPWLEALQADQVELRRYEHSPLVQVQGWSDVPRPLPLFDSIFVFEGFMETPREGVFQRTGYPLTLVVGPDREVVLRIDYELERFEPATIERLLGHLRIAVSSFPAGAERRLEEVGILTPEERQQLQEWSATGVRYGAADLLLHWIIEEQAASHPDALAVVFENVSLTYRELNAHANRLACRLQGMGVGPEVLVGVCAERSLEMVVALLAVLKAGGGYVPLDPSYPADRLAYMLEDSRVPVLLTQDRLLRRLPVHEARVVLLDAGKDAFTAAESHPAPGVTPDNVAYMIYTSGSTGRPKGAMNTHRAIVNRLLWMQEFFGLAAADRVLQKTPFSFDVSVWEFFWPLMTGACLVVAKPGGHQDPEYLADEIARMGVTTLHFVPSMLQVFLEARGLERCASLRRVVCSGEALPAELQRRFYELLDAPLFNLYGPTEAAVDVSCWSCQREDGRSTVPIGRPVANTELHIVDRRYRPVPIGVAGELLIGGIQVGRGYHGRPELTAERFVPDPFGSEEEGRSGARLYRTGDLARHLPDGAIEFLGRIDHQVKIRGLRIELGEIEAALATHPSIREAVVVATAGQRLVAYVVAAGSEVSAAELRAHLGSTLPDYMVPSVFVSLEALPLSPNGKVDRRALPEPQGVSLGAGAVFSAPRTPVEELVAGIWSEVLGIERIGREDNFFALGGHSLLATRVLSRMRETFQIDLPLRALFEARTVAELAPLIQAARSAGGAELPLLQPRSREGDLPLSFSQERLWFLDQLQPGSAVYNIPAAVRLSGTLDVAALGRSLGEVVRRHEALRTVFVLRAGGLVQVVREELRPGLPLVDLSAIPQGWREEELHCLSAAEARRPFDLVVGPLLRHTLLRLGEGEHVMLLTFHHIVSDGWSMGVFLRELTALYPAFSSGQPSPLPELPIQYADFALWQREWLAGETLERQVEYWRQRLAGAPAVTQIPTDRPRPAIQRYRGGSRPVHLDAELSRGLRKLGLGSGATTFMVLLAALDGLLSRYTGQDDLLVGTPVAGRTRTELEPLIGFFLNTLVLRVDASARPGFGELLARVRDVTLAAFAHQDLPFEKLVEELAPERSLSHAPFFQIQLVLQNAPMEALEIPGLRLTPMGADTGTAKFDLTLNATETPDGISGWWLFNRDILDGTTIERFSEHLRVLLEAAVAEPSRSVEDLPLLSPAEVQQFRDWSATGVRYGGDFILHRYIERQAERTPGAAAVLFGGERLTYRELNGRASRLAHRLRGLGVGPESLVGVCAERSCELVVALLAVLKAGGAYVPLDPGYPADRLAYMIEDSAVPVLLAQRELLERLPASGGARVVLLGEDEGGDETNPAVPVEPDHLAYMIYTSGSTGRPKGALNTHRAIVNRLLWMQEAFGLDETDRVLQKTPFSFDVSVWEFFWPLMTGACLVVAKPGGHQDPSYLAEEIVRRSVTTIHFVPSMLQVFLEAPGAGRCSSLRQVVCSGEALPFELQRRYYEVLSGPLHNLYGPTEAAVDVSWWACRRDASRAVVPIGYPVANTELYVLDHSGQPAPAGMPGELHIGGVQVGRGYHRRPELTAERFVPDPFGGFAEPRPGARLYRTGDLARHLADGAIEFLGRIDHQVKIRGLRIELGEIETALTVHAAVREAVVVAARPAAGAMVDWRLVGYVVPAGDAIVEAADLRAHLAFSLPEYMIPSAFVVLPALPLSPNGKVDRKALPAPDFETLRTGADHEPPRTELERGLAGLWSEVLGSVEVERIGLHDSFFDLGGNSITGAIFINRLQQVLGEIVHVVALFDAPVLGEFAAFLAREYPQAVARVWGGEPVDRAGGAEPSRPLDEELLAEVGHRIRTLSPFLLGPKNPPALFVLSPPRSGSTLLRVMLGGHPSLFAPPELELLNFNTLRERREAFSGRDGFRLEGLLRAVMEIQGREPEEARATVERLEEAEGATIQELYRRLQEWIQPRLLVDKTPTYAWDPATLRRAEEAFDGALYLHLVRHPYGVIRSFEEARIDQIFFPEDHPWSRRQLAEALWAIAHRHILEFLQTIPAQRRHTVRFEDLVRDPEGVLQELCAFLGLPYDPAMAEPYEKSSRRMTDGLHAESRMLGDVKFHEHRGVESGVAERWREVYTRDFLGEPTWRLAARLGYDIGRARVGSAREAAPLQRGDWRAGDPLPLSYAQERLWFLDQLDPGSNTYNVSMSVRLRGRLDPALLGRSLDEIVRRHATLRTTFAAHQGNPVQIVAPQLRIPLPVLDLSGLPESAREREGRAAVAAHSGEPFDLAQGPLLRAVLLRLEGENHLVSFAAHHIVCDGWSLGILVREVAILYTAFASGRPSPLPDLPIQYVDFASWQRRWLDGAALETHLAYWRGRLAGVPVLQLPSDRPRPALQSFRGSTHPFALPEDLSAKLRALGREQGTTLFMTLLGAFQALLSRYSGQEDFAVGSPVAGRDRAEIEGLIGFFVNTLVLRAPLGGDPAFTALLERVRTVALEAYAHQAVPFERIVQELAPERNLSYTPLFQVMLAFQNAPQGKLELPGLALIPAADEFSTSKFDISLTVFDSGPQIFGQWVYSTALFEEETIARWAGNFQIFLEDLASDPARPISELPLLTTAEREQILVEWNRPPVDYSDEGFVHQLFESQAEKTPEAVAVAFEDQTLTYRELNARANRLARHLRRLGAGPEALVGISAERSFEMVVGLFAILKAGSAYVPLDPSLPAERLAWMMEDAGIDLLLLQEQLLPLLPVNREALRTVVLDGDRFSGESPENPEFPVFPESPAYVIYTSGSTGQPKGVVVSHHALGNRLQYARTGDLLAVDAFLQKTTISFDVSLLEIFAPLVVGGRTVLARPGGQQDTAYLVRLIREQRITYTSFPPSLLSILFEQEGLEGCDSLRTVITGGETVPAGLPGQFYQRLPGADLYNRYGPTEATISVTSWRCEREATPRSLPIGRPTAKAYVYLLDAGFQPVPVRVAGEIFLGGLCVARGYHRQPGLTAEKFVPDPFASEPGARLYRTGDLARYRPDGAIEFVGRIDQQVKIRGFRVELGEIEAALARHPAVREVAVVDREDGPSRSLAAYLVLEPGAALEEAELRSFLLESLPPYMVPADFVTLAVLPLTPTGKIDRKALPAPQRRGTVAGFEPPRTPTEELLAAGWADLLSLDRIGIHDSFFDLGGHSLLAAQAISRVRETFGVDLPLRTLFERRTIAALAGEVDAAVRAGAGLQAPPLVPVPRGGDLPLSFAQERLWFLDRLQPGTSTYNLPVAVRLRGPLVVPALLASLREVVRRHEALRTTFVVRGDRPVQQIAPDFALPVPHVDLGALPKADREAAAQRLAMEERRRPFDLAAGPLVRTVLVRLEDTEHLAVVMMHHIVSDGWSVGVLIREVAALYGAALAGTPSPLPELSVQYADFAQWQRGWLRGDVLEAGMSYWRQRLAGAPPLLELPTDRLRPAVQRFRGRNLSRTLPEDLSRDLKALCRAKGVTSFMALLAGFQALLYRYTGRRDIIVGTPVAGRDRLEVERLIGLFLNSLALRTDLGGDPDVADLLERTRQTALEAYAHQDLPFEKLVEELAPERNLSHAPLFQVMLVFQNTPRELPESHGLTFAPVELDTDTAKFDLTLNARETERGFVLLWLYNRDLFDAATVARLSGHLEALLAGAVAAPGRRLSVLPLLTPAEERQLREWNTTAVSYPVDVCLHELIETQVERDPNRVAVVFETAGLTYGELNAAANRLAHRLIGMGVGPEVPVGIFAERSLEMVVALLAVLKAGGAYLPVDPDYPEDRISYMLADSAAPVLLTQSHLAGRLLQTGARLLLLDREETVGEESNPASGVAPGNLAYVIYTSGSTGRPKGTMNTHRGIVNRLLWMQEQYGLTPEDRVLQKTPFSFDVSVWEFFWPLLTGARLVMARPGGHQDAAYLVRTLQAEGITTLHFVPSMLQVFLEARGVESCVSLIRVIASGEALPLELQRRFFQRLGAGLHNLYGPTEAAVDVTYWPCEAESRRGVVPIGRPVANTRIHLLDANLRRVPVGVPGELHIGGIQVGRGYLGRPELTAERFIPDSFSPEPGERLYKTGDLARYLPDGAMDFLGRIDHQVKLRGLRIELGEIEAVLAGHPAVREAVVLARQEGSGALGAVNLVAYMTRAGETDPQPAELRNLLARSLPEYMLPSAWVVLEALPLSPNGKVDRKALAQIAPERTGDAPAERVAPRTEMERALAELWSEALGGLPAGSFGVYDNFFELGGNSITGALLINRLQEILGEIVHVVAIFDAPTIAALAASLAKEYPQAVARVWGPESLGEAGKAVAAELSRPLDEERLAAVQGLIRTLPSARLAAKNPPAVFVLSPPRSGSTLLRVMLAGHPLLFAPPELELLNFNTLAERREAFPGRDSFRLEGLLRAVMEVQGNGPEEARALVERFEKKGMTTQDLYHRFQSWIDPRLLVDKTPTYAWDPATLRRAEEAFEGACYLHLVRHPYGMIHSFEEARVDQIFFPENHPFSRRELAEALWVIAHRNILEFLAGVPKERQYMVRFEDLLRDPEGVLGGICSFLGIQYHPDMAEPYKKKSERMTDGLHAESRMLGDVKFHQHRGVEAGVAERWRETYVRDFLGDVTWKLASRLGYDAVKDRAGTAWPPSSLVKLRPGSSQRRLFLVHPLSGELLLYRHLIGGLGPDQEVYGFQARGFADSEQPLESIEEMADLYVEALLAFQPRGPYLLAGSSMGGLIAFEMARRLRNLGREVTLTALLDAPSPGSVAKDGEGEAEMDLLRYATGGRTAITLEDLRQLTPGQRLELILEEGREAGGLTVRMGIPELRRLVRILKANRRALRAYRPEPAGIRITYIRAAEGVRADATWESLALGGIEVHEVAGSHLSMHFPPHVEALAAQLACCIGRATSEAVEEEGAAMAGAR